MRVSSVNANGVTDDTFPATSTCRTPSTFVPSTALNDVLHDVPPSTEYSTVAPGSTFPIVRSATLVIRSVMFVPVSVVSDTVGAAADCVSSVNSKCVAGDLFPATSTCRTASTFVPSTALNDVLHDVPPSTVYSTVAPDSTFPIVRSARFVIRSVMFVPVSRVSDTVGAAADCVSSVNAKPVGSEALPAGSTCRRRTWLSPSTGDHCVLQVDPSSVEYSTVPSSSIVETVPVISTRKPVGPPPLLTTKSSVLIPSTKPPVTVNVSKDQ